MGSCLCREYVIAEVQKTEMDLLVFILRAADRPGRVFLHVVEFIQRSCIKITGTRRRSNKLMPC